MLRPEELDWHRDPVPYDCRDSVCRKYALKQLHAASDAATTALADVPAGFKVAAGKYEYEGPSIIRRFYPGWLAGQRAVRRLGLGTDPDRTPQGDDDDA